VILHPAGGDERRVSMAGDTTEVGVETRREIRLDQWLAILRRIDDMNEIAAECTSHDWSISDGSMVGKYCERSGRRGPKGLT